HRPGEVPGQCKLEQLLTGEPTPEEAAATADECRRLLVEARIGGSRAMTPDLPTAYDQLTPEDAAQIDAVCDRFERAWKATKAGGPVPCLASFMEQPGGCGRAVRHQGLVARHRPCRQRYGVAEGPEEPGAAAEDSELLATHRLRHDSDVLGGLPMGWPSIPGLE